MGEGVRRWEVVKGRSEEGRWKVRWGRGEKSGGRVMGKGWEMKGDGEGW